MKPIRIVLAAGGTGGHVFPALAVAAILQERGCEAVIFTDHRGAPMIADVPHRILRAGSPFQSGWGRRLNAVCQLALGTLSATIAMLAKRPQIVIGFGGYPSFAPMASAKLLGIPMMLHEQNAFVGRANHLLARQAGHLATSWPGTTNIPAKIAHFVAGMPVRGAFFATTGPTARDNKELLVIGGSQGAAIFAELVPAAIALLPKNLTAKLNITQQCRPEQIDNLRAAYDAADITATVEPFFTDIPNRMATSDLVISRSGASSVAELAAAGRAAILVPLPSAMDDHQTVNAAQLADIDGALLLPERGLSAADLASAMTELLTTPGRVIAMGDNARQIATPDAAARIADYALGLIGRLHIDEGGCA